MKFVRWCNNFMFSRAFNYFDVISMIIIIGAIVQTNNYWWFLLYVPTTLISVLMERVIKNG